MTYNLSSSVADPEPEVKRIAPKAVLHIFRCPYEVL